MHWNHTLLPLSLLPGIVQGRFQVPRNSLKTIQWGNCTFNGTTPVECANLMVPLDYTDPSSNRTLNLEILRSRAPVQPSMGSIFFNFGGPGLEARKNLANAASGFHRQTGGKYDLIAVDPRGTGNTLTYSCYDTELERQIATLSFPALFGNESDTALSRAWANMKVNADACAAKRADIGQFVGTAFTARDMMQVVDVLGGDGELNFWGFSYGTILGATVAAMFPDRMGLVVLDGVLNAHEYYHDYDIEWFVDMDAEFTTFIRECLAYPSNCLLATHNQSAAALESLLYTRLETLKYSPIAHNGTVLTYQAAKGAIFAAMYGTSSWPLLAEGLHGLLTGNMTAMANLLALVSKPSASTAEAQFGVKCSDKVTRSAKIDDLLPAHEKLMKISRMGGDVPTSLLMICSQWGFDAKERYMGNFRVKTKNPVLFVGNTWDGYTPWASAVNMSAGFEGSVALQHNASGHSSLGQPSNCTFGAIGDYFVNGTLPAPGTVCQPNSMAFAPSKTTT